MLQIEIAEARKETTLLIWGVPIDLKQRFKALCALRQTSMKEEIIRLMQKEIEKRD